MFDGIYGTGTGVNDGVVPRANNFFPVGIPERGRIIAGRIQQVSIRIQYAEPNITLSFFGHLIGVKHEFNANLIHTAGPGSLIFILLTLVHPRVKSDNLYLFGRSEEHTSELQS